MGLPLTSAVRPHHRRSHEQGASLADRARRERPTTSESSGAKAHDSEDRPHRPHRHARDEDAAGRRRGGFFTAPNGLRGAMLRAYNKATGNEVGAVYMPAPQSGTP